MITSPDFDKAAFKPLTMLDVTNGSVPFVSETVSLSLVSFRDQGVVALGVDFVVFVLSVQALKVISEFRHTDEGPSRYGLLGALATVNSVVESE